ncbi:MAG TPA: hypothetical protein VLA88_02770 [Candidatus Saccharimonadales bacterium]|nr:hypothetical protein [Candidatus Saccharimonadales bacterium]
MKKTIQILSGTLIIASGLIATFISFSELLKGQWLWLILAIAAMAVAAAGWRILLGHRLKDILHDLLFVLIRTN